MSAEAPMERVTDEGAPPPATPVETTTTAPAPVDPFAAIQSALETQFADTPVVAPAPVAPDTTPGPATAVVPALETPSVEAPVPTPQSRFAQIFDLPPGDEGYRAAGELLTEWKGYDSPAYYAVAETIYAQERPQITRMVLEDLGRESGVSPEVVRARVNQVFDYIKSGTGLSAPVQQATFPTLESVDQYGYIRLPSGRDIQVKDANGNELPEGMETYDGAKFRFETEQRERQREAQEAETTRQQSEQRAQNLKSMQTYATEATFEDFHSASQAALKTLLEPSLVNLATGEDKLMGQMMISHVGRFVESHPEITKIAERITAYLHQLVPSVVQRGAEQRMNADQIKAECAKILQRGRVADLIKDYNDMAKREAEAIKAQFESYILRRNKAELAATGTDPVMPEGTQTITATTPVAPSNLPPRNLEDALERVRGIVGPVLQ